MGRLWIMFGLVHPASSHLFALALAFLMLKTAAFAQSSPGIRLKRMTSGIGVLLGRFGNTVAALGNDRIFTGTPNQSPHRCFIFGTNGSLLHIIVPPAGGEAGWSVATMGTDGLLVGAVSAAIGATGTGAAYLFNTNGSLITTFTNPTPVINDSFGFSLAALGADRVLIGANRDDTGATDTGAAYLFRTNGTLLATFNNPTPQANDLFGSAVATVSSNLVLIGAYQDNTGATNAGAVYLFRTNGVLVSTFTNPSPQAIDLFGWSVAVVGNDRIVIGASRDDTGATDAGAAYLFNTNGNLLTTFTNPAPGTFDLFGGSVASVGNDKVLIGAYGDDTSFPDTGAAFLFDTNGILLATFAPTSGYPGLFGWSVASLDADRVIIGAPRENGDDLNSGAIYLFRIPYPRPTLRAARNASAVSLSWVTPESGLILEEAVLLGSSAVWSNVTASVSVNGTTNVVQQTLGSTNRFYRLRRP